MAEKEITITELLPEDKKLIKVIRDMQWGEVTGIKVKNGKPVMVTLIKVVKLD